MTAKIQAFGRIGYANELQRLGYDGDSLQFIQAAISEFYVRGADALCYDVVDGENSKIGCFYLLRNGDWEKLRLTAKLEGREGILLDWGVIR